VRERQVDQETVAIVQSAEDDRVPKQGNGRRTSVYSDEYFATDARWQSSGTLSVARGSSSSDLDR